MQEVGNGRYYMITPNQWMTAADVSAWVCWLSRAGFSATPHFLRLDIELFQPGRSNPSARLDTGQDYTGRVLNLHECANLR
jgi:hypothetical protein